MSMPENCYLILGIRRGASREEIRRAYRSIIRRLHPDVTRTDESTPEFLKVREAYETLMDKEKRRLHDLQLDRMSAASGSAARWPAARYPSRPAADPFRDLPASVFEELLFRFFAGPAAPGSSSARIAGRWPSAFGPQEPELEIELTPAEAERGGRLPVSVPTERECPRCSGRRPDGSGLQWGWHRSEREIYLDIPAGIADGAVLYRSLADIGRPEALRATIRIRRHVA